MGDLYLTEEGDLAVSNHGDLGLTETPWRHFSQQAYIRIMTQIGDFVVYPTLGADLETMIGMPQSQSTAEYGKSLILNALTRDGVLSSFPIEIVAIPTTLQTIQFDIYMTVGSRSDLILSIEQDIGIEQV